jgi:hypothetical protein
VFLLDDHDFERPLQPRPSGGPGLTEFTYTGPISIAWGVSMSDVPRILNAIERGDANSTDQPLPLVYEELQVFLVSYDD